MQLCIVIIMWSFTCYLADTHPTVSKEVRKNSSGPSSQKNRKSEIRELGKYPISCQDNFTAQIQHCLHPFSRNVDMYISSRPRNPFVYQIFIKHVCRKYKKTLLCVHTALTNCPSVTNMHTVQNSLSKVWVTEVNQMCNIQSNSTSQNGNSNQGNKNEVEQMSSEIPKTLSESESVTENKWASRLNINSEHGRRNKGRNPKFFNKSIKWSLDDRAADNNSENSDSSNIEDSANHKTDRPDIVINVYGPNGKGHRQDVPSLPKHKKYYNQTEKKHSELFKWLMIVIRNDSDERNIQVNFGSESQLKSPNYSDTLSANDRSSANNVIYKYGFYSWCVIIIIQLFLHLIK